MKSNTAVITLTAIAFLFGARTPASAQSSYPQAASPAVANPAPGGSFGLPLLTPIDQVRSVSAFASCDSGGFSSEYYEELDFGPFSATASAATQCASAVAIQHSEILKDGIVASGYASGSQSSGFFPGTGTGSSYVHVRFSVAEPVSYRATGYIFGGVFQLFDQYGPLFTVAGQAPGYAFYTSIDEVGLLMPGKYSFVFSQTFNESLYDLGWNQDTYDLAFDLDLCDTTPPLLSYPSSVSVTDAKGGTPGEFVFFSVTAADVHDPTPTVVCVPPSGSFFPRGTTMVTCTATDASGNQSTCTFPVVVQPTVRRHRL